MREIKFKSITKNDDKYFEYIFDLFKDGVESQELLELGEEMIAYGLQYTGFKDKNGKEIYEGDILKLRDASELRYYVKYENGAFYLFNTLQIDPTTGKEYRWGLLSRAFDEKSMFNIQIIGNIYT